MAAHTGHSRNLIDLGSDRFATPVVLVAPDGTPLVLGSSLTVDTELPAARLAADNLAFATAPDVLATLMGRDPSDTMDMLHCTGVAVDAVNAHNSGMLTVAPYNMLLNPAGSWDRQRANFEGTVLASAARVATTNSPDQTNHNLKGVLIFFSITAVPTVETVTLAVTAKDPVAGTYETLLTGAAEAAAATRCYLIYPGAGAAANGVDVVAAYPLPRVWRVTITHSASGSFTYSVGYALVK